MKTKTTRERKKTAKAATAARGVATAKPLADRMNVQSILVPTDFSTASEKALLYAANFVKHFGARLSLLHVVESVVSADFTNSFPLAMENSKVRAEFKRRMEKMLKNTGIDRENVDKLLIRYGRAYQEIAEAARSANSDLIIISTHGYTGLKHILLGSATEKVVRHAPCPVLVVRLQEHEFVNASTKPSTEYSL